MLQAFWQANPIRILTSLAVIIQAGFVVLAAFGHSVTPTQQAAITGFLTVIIGEIARNQVTPNSSVPQPLPPSVKNQP